MTITFTIGAPSLTGKGAHEDAEAIIDGLDFPCVLHVVNRMPRAAVFPESGIELASVFAGIGHSAAVSFASAAVLKRLLRCASEVAELNGYAQALTISDAPVPSISDDAQTQQVAEAHPGLRHVIDAAGGVDAVATMASTDAVVVARDTSGDDGPADHHDTAPAGEDTPAVAEVATLPKAVGKKFKRPSGASR